VKRRVNVGAGLRAHLNAQEVEAIFGNGAVHGQHRSRVARVDLGVCIDAVREVYDTNYLHNQELLHSRQVRSSI